VAEPLNVIHPSARIGAGTTIGAFSVVGENVSIGERCVIGCGVVIHAGSRVGDEVRIDDHSVIGKPPLRGPRSALTRDTPSTAAEIGDGCLVGTSAVIYAGARIGERVLVADFASVREGTTIGAETVIGRNVTVENRTTIGARCKIETNAYVTALSTIGDDCFVAPEATFTNDDYLGRSEKRFEHHGGPTLETGARVGANCTILPGRKIARDGVVAAGAVVTRDVPPRTIVMGVPAVVHGPVPEDELLENQ
jgi:UDP-2-acetamido-3-amino-2,3-dideoxy-glucuronate N-acetyltransferase